MENLYLGGTSKWGGGGGVGGAMGREKEMEWREWMVRKGLC